MVLYSGVDAGFPRKLEALYHIYYYFVNILRVASIFEASWASKKSLGSSPDK